MSGTCGATAGSVLFPLELPVNLGGLLHFGLIQRDSLEIVDEILAQQLFQVGRAGRNLCIRYK